MLQTYIMNNPGTLLGQPGRFQVKKYFQLVKLIGFISVQYTVENIFLYHLLLCRVMPCNSFFPIFYIV